MIKVGIDHSINSTGVCISNGEKTQWILISSVEKPNKMMRKLSELNDVTIMTYERTGDNLIDGQRVGKIITEAIKELQRLWKENELTIVKEDYAYSAVWNTLVQLVEHSSLMVYTIEKELGVTIHKISPKSIKKAFTGNGNANKDAMHVTFVNTEIKGPFHNFCCKYDKAQKHVNDLVDSYAIMKMCTSDAY